MHQNKDNEICGILIKNLNSKFHQKIKTGLIPGFLILNSDN